MHVTPVEAEKCIPHCFQGTPIKARQLCVMPIPVVVSAPGLRVLITCQKQQVSMPNRARNHAIASNTHTKQDGGQQSECDRHSAALIAHRSWRNSSERKIPRTVHHEI